MDNINIGTTGGKKIIESGKNKAINIVQNIKKSYFFRENHFPIKTSAKNPTMEDVDKRIPIYKELPTARSIITGTL